MRGKGEKSILMFFLVLEASSRNIKKMRNASSDNEL
jgi:hypothetical protein